MDRAVEPQTCILSHSQQGATQLVPKRSLIVCELMRKLVLI